ncbi:MAG: response regulator transcription factor [Nitrospinaceae bacterium]|jgi:DNA-binding NarL/FixJ family response regulator|nr:response regulator transcription factor [Nitrospinaceae bacterium]
MKKRLKVFILDDSQEVSKRLVNMLSELDGTEVVGMAENSEEAWRTIRKLQPHAVILDSSLPTVGRIETLLKEIKKLQPETKVIIFSHHSSPRYREKCMDLGADFYFDKATEFEKVPQTITQWAYEYSQTETS